MARYVEPQRTYTAAKAAKTSVVAPAEAWGETVSFPVALEEVAMGVVVVDMIRANF
jgi:hypothetical protein